MNADEQNELIELIESARLVMDTSGEKKAVLVEYRVWEGLLELLEDLSDLREIRRIQESGEKPIPWERFKAELRADGINV